MEQNPEISTSVAPESDAATAPRAQELGARPRHALEPCHRHHYFLLSAREGEGTSMTPLISDKDAFLSNKFVYRFEPIGAAMLCLWYPFGSLEIIYPSGVVGLPEEPRSRSRWKRVRQRQRFSAFRIHHALDK